MAKWLMVMNTGGQFGLYQSVAVVYGVPQGGFVRRVAGHQVKDAVMRLAATATADRNTGRKIPRFGAVGIRRNKKFAYRKTILE